MISTEGKEFTTETKLRALERDAYICQCCGVRLMRDKRCGTGQPYHIHHKKLKSLGGTNSLANAASVCTGCHDLLHTVQNKGYTYPKACIILKTAKHNKCSVEETIRKLLH
jgi:predicted HNH restriction endonuclease